jgi:hypothetical protein
MSPLCKHLMISLSLDIAKKSRRVISTGSRVNMGCVEVLMQLFSDDMWDSSGFFEDYKRFLLILMCLRSKLHPG